MPDPLGVVEPYLNFGLGGIVAAFIFAILWGRLVPAPQMERIIQVHKDMAEDLKVANAHKDETVQILSKALDENTRELSRLAEVLAVTPSPEGRGR